MQKLLSREDMMNKKHNFQKCQTHRKHFKGAWVKLGYNPSFEGHMGSYEPRGRIDYRLHKTLYTTLYMTLYTTPYTNPFTTLGVICGSYGVYMTIQPYMTLDLGKNPALPGPF